MKKIIIAAFLVLTSGTALMAQSEVKAKAILADVSKKYRAYDVIKTDFSYTLENPEAKIKETQTGTLFVRSKMNKYKIILNDKISIKFHLNNLWLKK